MLRWSCFKYQIKTSNAIVDKWRKQISIQVPAGRHIYRILYGLSVEPQRGEISRNTYRSAGALESEYIY